MRSLWTDVCDELPVILLHFLLTQSSHFSLTQWGWMNCDSALNQEDTKWSLWIIARFLLLNLSLEINKCTHHLWPHKHTNLHEHTRSYWRRRCGAPARSFLLFILCSGTEGSAVICNNPAKSVGSSDQQKHSRCRAAPKNSETDSVTLTEPQRAAMCVRTSVALISTHTHTQLCKVSGLECSSSSKHGLAESKTDWLPQHCPEKRLQSTTPEFNTKFKTHTG